MAEKIRKQLRKGKEKDLSDLNNEDMAELSGIDVNVFEDMKHGEYDFKLSEITILETIFNIKLI